MGDIRFCCFVCISSTPFHCGLVENIRFSLIQQQSICKLIARIRGRVRPFYLCHSFSLILGYFTDLGLRVEIRSRQVVRPTRNVKWQWYILNSVDCVDDKFGVS